MARRLEVLRGMLKGEVPLPPIARLVGFTLVSVEAGEVVIEFEANERHANLVGTLHGGALCVIADAAMSMAYGSTLEEGQTYATLELKINYLKPVWKGRLRAVGRVVKGGQTVGLVECDVTDAEQHLVARAMGTCMTLRGDQAQGR